ncbi:Chromatin modification-related protein EAF6 [Cyberlindnera fabianii]|uniref:Chromatin modification-related protein EAF6 n=1 Tax=Cyberlindnera fabianii TaxID=36022 RepID=A0A1V2L9H1_CYBFA|nr:Chromatin modification-related protein EAF6 [Cyberlindnera fabianii]
MTDIREYEALKKQLQQAILKKKTLDKQLTNIEEEIYARETTYLSEPSGGNIVRGLEALTKGNPSSSAGGSALKKRPLFTDDDRIFSLSSHTFVRHLQKSNEREEEEESAESTPATTAAQRKRKRAD